MLHPADRPAASCGSGGAPSYAFMCMVVHARANAADSCTCCCTEASSPTQYGVKVVALRGLPASAAAAFTTCNSHLCATFY
jgi:hypothetical protein